MRTILGAMVGTLVALALVALMDIFLRPSLVIGMPVSFILGMGLSMTGIRVARKL